MNEKAGGSPAFFVAVSSLPSLTGDFHQQQAEAEMNSQAKAPSSIGRQPLAINFRRSVSKPMAASDSDSRKVVISAICDLVSTGMVTTLLTRTRATKPATNQGKAIGLRP